MMQPESRYLAPITVDHAAQGRAGKTVVLTGNLLQLAVVYLPPNAEIPWHSHPAETIVTVISGGYDIWVGNDHFRLEPGWAAWIPANVPHRALVGTEPAVEIEAFAPPREEYAARTPHYDFRRLSLSPDDYRPETLQE